MFKQNFIVMVGLVGFTTFVSLLGCEDEDTKSKVRTVKVVLPQPPPLPPEPEEQDEKPEENSSQQDREASLNASDDKEQHVVTGVEGKLWSYTLSPNQFHRFVNDGVVYLLLAENALESDYSLSRYVFEDGRWKLNTEFTESDIQNFSLNCRIFTAAFDKLFNGLPVLDPADRYLLAFPESLMARVADVDAEYEEYSVDITVRDENLMAECMAGGYRQFGPMKVVGD